MFLEALAVLPLALAAALVFSAPIIIAALSPFVLHERVSLARWIGVAVGFVGVLVIVQPGSNDFQPEALLAVGSALSYAASLLLARRLGATDPPAATAFYTGVMFFVGSLPYVLAVPSAWVTPDTGLIWAGFYGYVVWDETPTWVMTYGILLIMAGGLWIIFSERRRKSAGA